MCGELGKQVRVVGKRLDLKTSSIDIDTQQLSSITAEGNLFDLVGVDESKEFGISDIGWSTAWALDDHFDSRSFLDGRSSNLVDIDVEGHAQCISRAAILGCGERGVRSKGADLLSQEQGQDGCCGEFHFVYKYKRL